MIRALVEQTFDQYKKYFVLAGTSEDAKPTTGLITGSKFLEVDTGTAYQFDEVSSSWTAVGITEAEIKAEIDAWLDEHPEATTTVEDGAISYAKLNSSLQSAADNAGEVPTLKTALENTKILPYNYSKYLHGGHIDTSTNKWADVGSRSKRFSVMPVKAGDSIVIKANSILAAEIAMLTAYDNEQTAGDDPDFSSATGWTAVKTVTAGTTFEGTVPSDAVYLYCYLGTIDGSTTPASILIGGYDFTQNLYANISEIVGDVGELKSAVTEQAENSNGQIVDLIAISGEHNNGTSNGVTFAWSEDGKTCHASGTSSASTNGINNIWVQSTIYPPAMLNRKPLFYVESTNPEHLYGQVYWYIGGSIQNDRIDLKHGYTEVTIPATANGFALRIIADKGQIVYDDDISVRMILGDQSYIPSMGKGAIDMKAAIESVLTAFGECHLGPGVFGVSGIDMPEGSTLYGCGDKTEIRLIGTSAGYAVKMASKCTVRDLMLAGSNADITLSETVGNRHGILWQGNYANEYGEGSADRKENQPSYGTVSNVWIKRFTGGGITCDNTGPSVNHGLNVTNVNITNCNAGINVAYYSEFHRFTNVMAYLCQYACVNNGGNNVFVNCGFSNSKVGIITKMVDGSTIIDRDTGTAVTRPTTNNTHGSAIGCVFNHMDRDNNTLGIGEAVHIEDGANGFVFSGCQFFYGVIYIENSTAVKFDSCLFGPNKSSESPYSTVGYSITLKNTGASNLRTFFNGCNFSIMSNAGQHSPEFTVVNTGSGTMAPVIDACYNRKGDAVVYPYS